MKRCNAVISADWHIRDDQPPCRTDKFVETQQAKLHFINSILVEHTAPLLFSGDKFHVSRSKPGVELFALRNAPIYEYIIPGNHDLPAHSLSRFDESSLAVYAMATKETSDVVTQYSELVLNDTCDDQFSVAFFPFGTELFGVTESLDRNEGRKIALCHTLVVDGPSPIPGAMTAAQLMDLMPGFDLIVVGDNHKPFVYERDGRIVLSPGSITRQKADDDHEPSIWLWYEADNRLERVVLPHDPQAVSREHIEVVEMRDERIELFVSRLCNEYEAGLSFEDNLRNALAANPVPALVEQLIWEALGK